MHNSAQAPHLNESLSFSSPLNKTQRIGILELVAVQHQLMQPVSQACWDDIQFMAKAPFVWLFTLNGNAPRMSFSKVPHTDNSFSRQHCPLKWMSGFQLKSQRSWNCSLGNANRVSMVMIPYCEHFFALALRPGAMELEEQEEEEGKWVLFDCWVLHWFSKEPSLLFPGPNGIFISGNKHRVFRCFLRTLTSLHDCCAVYPFI